MKSMRLLAGASLLTCGILLAACGGGGVNSTPTPTPGTPTPTPGGTPTPSPGTPTPTPTPGTPTPTPPTGTNDDLLTPLVSESFKNLGASASGSYFLNGNPGTNTAARAAMGVSYDAGTKRYTITIGSRTQSFGPSEKNASASNALIDVYTRVNGDTAESLTLTRPGTAGALRYRYVGAGFWQKTTQGTTTINGTLDSFVYGMETPNSAVPRSGQGNFTTDILGTIASPYDLVSFSGTGGLAVRFDTGDITLNGKYTSIDPISGAPNPQQNYDGTATLSASSNDFTGKLNIFPLETTLNGRFYGPAASELGAVFVGSSGGYSITGTLLGRRAGSGTGGGDGLLAIVGDRQFDNFTGHQHYPSLAVRPSAFVFDANGNFVGTAGGRDFDQLIVNYGAGSFELLSTNSPLVDFTSANRVAAESNASYSFYRRESGDNVDELRISNPGSSNPTIALTYTSFGTWIHQRPHEVSGQDYFSESHFVFGLRTDPTIFPTSGSASYQGILAGSGASADNHYSVSGGFAANVNFASNSISGSLSPILRNLANSSVLNIPSAAFNGSFVSSTDYRFDVTTGSLGASSEGISMTGYFYGPTANEMGGIFFGSLANPNDANEWINVNGVGVAK